MLIKYRNVIVVVILFIISIGVWATVATVATLQPASNSPEPMPTLADIAAQDTPIIDETADNPELIIEDTLEDNPEIIIEDTSDTTDPIAIPDIVIVESKIDMQQDPIVDRYIVELLDGQSLESITELADELDVAVIETISELNSVVIVADASTITRLESESTVSTEPDYYASALYSVPPSDPLYQAQWNMDMIGAPSAWEQLAADTPAIQVAVIDSGVCLDHPDMQGAYSDFQWDYVQNDAVPQDELGHGCGVAGVIASQNNDIGTIGVAPFAKIMPLRVLGANGIGTYSNIAQAIVDATNQGAQIINLSLGGYNDSNLLKSAINYALANDVYVVAATGNDGGSQPLYPANYAGVIAVGSVNEAGNISTFSNRGEDTLAPGEVVPAPYINNNYVYQSGTSFAAPHVAGVIALELALGQTPSFDGGLIAVNIDDAPIIEPTPAATEAPETITVNGRTIPYFERYEPQTSDRWVVQLQDNVDAGALANQLGFQNLGQVGELNNYYIFAQDGSGSSESIALSVGQVLSTAPQIIEFEQEFTQYREAYAVPTDPQVGDQWHLINTGQSGGTAGVDANVTGAWDDGYDGSGVTIAVVDDGLEITHPDFASKYNSAASFDFNGSDPISLTDQDSNPSHEAPDSGHGTSAGGVAVADDDGTVCGVGVAYNAGVSGLRFLSDNGITTDSMEATTFNYAMQTNDIYTNSWGPANTGYFMSGPGPLAENAFMNGVNNGRGGNGNIYVFAAGNNAEYLGHANANGYANSRYTIAVAATDHNGERSPYSEMGTNLLVNAPSNIFSYANPNLTGGGIVTTDRLGTAGYNNQSGFSNNCTDDFGGTSSATPVISGVIALMLEANPNLTWRDVQHILVETARKNDPTDILWNTNGAGRDFNIQYGFGTVDASAAVAMAETWTIVAPEVSYTSGVIPMSAALDDGSGDFSNDIQVAGEPVIIQHTVDDNINIESVEVQLDANHTYWGDLRFYITSPSGTTSFLYPARKFDSSTGAFSWTVSSMEFWGEDSAGVWTLFVEDVWTGDTGTVDGFSMTFNGTDGSGTTAVVTADASITAGQSISISVTDPDSAGSGNRDVIAFVGHDSEIVSLTETGPSTGVFTGTLFTSYDNVADAHLNNHLNVVGGNVVTLLYFDARTPSGGPEYAVAETNVTYTPLANVELNEIARDDSSNGNPAYDYIEIIGPPGTNLDTVSLIELTSYGEVINRLEFSASDVIPADGIYVLADTETEIAFGITSDGSSYTGVDFFMWESTFLLVENYTGCSTGCDFDQDNNGTLDNINILWTNILDTVSFDAPDGIGYLYTAAYDSNYVYATTVSTGAEPNAEQCTFWQAHPGGVDVQGTPGTANTCGIPTGNDGVLSVDATIGVNDRISISLTDADTAGYGVINIKATAGNETEIINLIETGANTGVFTNVLRTAFGFSSDETDNDWLNVRSGDVITFSYSDYLRADGGINIEVFENTNITGGAESIITANDPTSAGQPILISVTDADSAGNGSTTINTKSGNDIEPISLTETGAGTGVFTGTLNTVNQNGDDGTTNGSLNVQDGDIITLMYYDYFRPNGSAGTIYAFLDVVWVGPAAPSALSVNTVIGQKQLDLSWTDNSSTETGFRIERSPSGTNIWEPIGTVDANITTYTDTDATLSCYTAYDYRIIAVRSGDTSVSSPSGTASAQTSCTTVTAPDSLTSDGTVDVVVLNWNDKSPDETNFEIQRSISGTGSFDVSSTVPTNVTTYTDLTTVCGGEYDYRVRAYRDGDTNYSAFSNISNVKQLCEPPATPSDLTVLPIPFTNDMELDWADNSTTETDFYLERSTDGSNWAQIATLSEDVITYTDTDAGLACYTSYYYQIRAFRADDGVYSSYSNIALATTWCDPDDTIVVVDGAFNTSASTGDVSGVVGFPQPSCAPNISHAYVWELSENSPTFLNTFGSSFNTVLAYYTWDGTTLTEMGCNDEGSVDGTSALATNNASGLTELYIVSGKNHASGNIAFKSAPIVPPTATPLPTFTPIPTATDTPDLTTVGVFQNGVWQFRDSNERGTADFTVRFGATVGSNWQPVIGDWNGDGIDGFGLYRDGRWILRDVIESGNAIDYDFMFGTTDSSWQPIVGDWDGDGDDGIGLYKDGVWMLKDENSRGNADYQFYFNPSAVPNAIPIAGDWHDESTDRVGLYDNGRWYLSYDHRTNSNAKSFAYGPTDGTWLPIVGDWDEDGDDTIGIYKDGNWRLRNTNTRGNTDIGLAFGDNGALPIAGYRGDAGGLALFVVLADVNTDTVASATPLPTIDNVPLTTPVIFEETATIAPTDDVTETTSPSATPELVEEIATLVPTATLTPMPSSTPIVMPTATHTPTEVPPEIPDNTSGTE